MTWEVWVDKEHWSAIRPVVMWATRGLEGKGKEGVNTSWVPAPAALGDSSRGLLSTTTCEGIISGLSRGLTLGPDFYSHHHSETSEQPMLSCNMRVRSKAWRVEYHTAAQKWNQNLEALNLTSQFELWSSLLLKIKIPFSCLNNVCLWQKKSMRKYSQIFNFWIRNAFTYLEKQKLSKEKRCCCSVDSFWRLFMHVWMAFCLCTVMIAWTHYTVSCFLFF